MNFENIDKVSEYQVKFCRSIGIEVEGDTIGIAAAKIEEKIQISFWNNSELGKPTTKQVALANKFGVNIENMSRIVGDAIIYDIMIQLNANAIKSQNLKPGCQVKNKNEQNGSIYVISSISPDGTVYFKGGNGKRAWARSLVNVNSP